MKRLNVEKSICWNQKNWVHRKIYASNTIRLLTSNTVLVILARVYQWRAKCRPHFLLTNNENWVNFKRIAWWHSLPGNSCTQKTILSPAALFVVQFCKIFTETNCNADTINCLHEFKICYTLYHISINSSFSLFSNGFE